MRQEFEKDPRGPERLRLFEEELELIDLAMNISAQENFILADKMLDKLQQVVTDQILKPVDTFWPMRTVLPLWNATIRPYQTSEQVRHLNVKFN